MRELPVPGQQEPGRDLMPVDDVSSDSHAESMGGVAAEKATPLGRVVAWGAASAATVGGLAEYGFARLAAAGHGHWWDPASFALTSAQWYDVTRSSITFAGLVGAGAAGLLAYRRQRTTEANLEVERRRQRTAEDTHALERRRHTLSEDADLRSRFTTASEQLGHEKAAVRVAGVYGLAQLADEWARRRDNTQRQACIDVLCAYLRMPTTADALDELEVRDTIVRLIAAHVRPDQPDSWSDALFDFAGTWFRHANFSGATFRGGVVFDRTTFSDIAYFKGATFASDAPFDQATFDLEAVFSDATFARYSLFNQATFTGRAIFDAATFTGQAYFNRAMFGSSASFQEVTFYDLASIAASTFTRTPNFRGAAFSKTVFSGATFTDGADFPDATFADRSDFQSVTFTGAASFERARFDSIVLFDKATFAGRTSFNKATFTDHTSFAQVTFALGHPDGLPEGCAGGLVEVSLRSLSPDPISSEEPGDPAA